MLRNWVLQDTNEKLHKGELRHIVYRMSKSENECIIIFVVNDTKLNDKFKKLAKKVMEEFAHVKRLPDKLQHTQG